MSRPVVNVRRPVVNMHLIPGSECTQATGQRAFRALRIRASLTGRAVPSCWAHRLTRSSSSIRRLETRLSLAARGERAVVAALDNSVTRLRSLAAAALSAPYAPKPSGVMPRGFTRS